MVADDPSTAVSIRQAGDNPGVAGELHLICICVKYTVIMCFAVFKNFLYFCVFLKAIGFQGVFHHPVAAEWHDCAL